MKTMSREKFEREFICPKCHAHGATTQEVNVGRAVAGMFPLPASRYFAVSCALCGYTEFYLLAIAVRAAETAPATGKLAEKPE
ncbi:MAG: zinc ribbon domain-containing protein [bacterium]|nr:zinc ribbon domain-containing protein [bacterium]